ncbi:hypothetical protein M9H77_13000 [Catharanthus roseus]|uniref:Uncharacterized protein n=1 Tax=Catharanthus roseus TaxID=4058 RepID=A0ACC0BJ05_CATRO|nr:hypothetical protein M9H77_13000 [Catharanthus roseus]
MHRSGAPHREWIHLKRGIAPQRVLPNWSMWTPHHALRWDGSLVESQEGLETKVGPRADLVGAPRIYSLLTQDGQRYSKPLKLSVEFFVRVSSKGHVFLFCFLMLEPFVKVTRIDDNVSTMFMFNEPRICPS